LKNIIVESTKKYSLRPILTEPLTHFTLIKKKCISEREREMDLSALIRGVSGLDKTNKTESSNRTKLKKYPSLFGSV